MATDNSRMHLTDQEVLLERVMREIVAQVQDAGFVLKCGGALVFAYGSHRHTTDLDFDAERTTDMRRRIRRAIRMGIIYKSSQTHVEQGDHHQRHQDWQVSRHPAIYRRCSAQIPC